MCNRREVSKGVCGKMITEEEVIKMLNKVNNLIANDPTNYTAHAIRAFICIILERDAESDLKYLEDSVEVEK